MVLKGRMIAATYKYRCTYIVRSLSWSAAVTSFSFVGLSPSVKLKVLDFFVFKY